MLLSFLGSAQTTVLYSENFDGPAPYSVTNSFLQTGVNAPTIFWDTVSNIANSIPHSYKIQGSATGTNLIFETNSFSTIGYPYIHFSFSHIAKTYLTNNCRIEYSTNGLTWNSLPSSAYLGSQNYSAATYVASQLFNVSSYVLPFVGLDLWESTLNSSANNNMWVEEGFDLRGVANDPNGFIGYPSVKLRFIVDFIFTPPFPVGSFYDGWYVDDIVVTGSTCPINLSKVVYNLGPSAFTLHKPIGKIPENSSGNYRVALTATNLNGIVSGVDLVYVKNGVSTTVTMLSDPNNSDEYSYDISNLLVGDTVNWHVEVNVPGCSNPVLDPATSYQFIIIEAVPSQCGTVFVDESPYIINDFPWTEDFEGAPWVAGFGNYPSSTNLHRGSLATYPDGNWSAVPNTDLANSTSYSWGLAGSSIQGTAGLTGPSSNHTTGGQNYLFTAGNFHFPINGSGVASTRIFTPCIELDDSLYYVFEFWYHMFGQDIGELRIDIDTGTVNPSWWVDYYSISGQKQTSSNDPWQKTTIPLFQFKGKRIKIRINARKFSTGVNSFLALDDFSIYSTNPDSIDLELVELLNPLVESCSYTNAEILKLRLKNNGLDTIKEIPIAFQLNNNSIVRDTIHNISLSAFDTLSFQFSPTIDLSAIQTHSIKIWTEVVGDQNVVNDTLIRSIVNLPGISTFPFLEDFENATPALNLNGTGSMNTSVFNQNSIDNSSTNGAKWSIYNGVVRFAQSGPLGGAQREGNYLLFTNEGVTTNSQSARFETNCVDFSGLLNPQLSFHFHNSSSTGRLRISVKEVGSSNWVLLNSYFNSQISKGIDYKLIQIDLSAYAGKLVSIRIEGDKSSVGSSYFALDNIRLFERKTTDYSLSSVASPSYRIESNGLNSSTVSFDLLNSGLFANSKTMKLKLQLIEVCTIGNPAIITGQTSTFTNSAGYLSSKLMSQNMTFSSPLIPGYYRMKAWIEVSGDLNSFNDTVDKNILIVGDQIIPYNNDFENCNEEFFGAGEIQDWSRGDASKAGWLGAKSGQNTWITNTSENGVSSTENLLVPNLIGFDTIYDAEVRFWQIYNFGAGYGSLEFLNGANWESVETFNGPQGLNWSTQFDQALNKLVFKNSSAGWIYSSFPLSRFNKRTSPLKLRFSSSFHGAPGWAIDDFEIFIPEQNSASPTEMLFTTQSLPVVGPSLIKVRVLNSGHAPLDEFQLSINASGTIQNEHFSLSNPINPGQFTIVSVSNPIVLSSGPNTIEIISSRPNNRTDELTLDDTLKVDVNVLPIISSLPYCNDFEQSQSFANYSTTLSKTDTNWIYGLPNKSVLNSVHSGINSWFTANANYYPQQDQYLFTNEFLVNKNQCYELSFWHQFYTEVNNDGAMVQYSVDSSKTWLTLGSINDSNWYNTPYIQSLDAIHPGWSGLSNGWEKVKTTIQFFDTTKVQFRFRFATSSILHFEGWAIDDFCFEPLPGPCSFIGQEEEIARVSGLDLFPNPAQNELNIIYQGPLHGEVTMRIFNALGQEVNSSDKNIQPGERITIPTEAYAKGLFVLLIEFKSGEKVSKAFEKL